MQVQAEPDAPSAHHRGEKSVSDHVPATEDSIKQSDWCESKRPPDIDNPGIVHPPRIYPNNHHHRHREKRAGNYKWNGVHGKRDDSSAPILVELLISGKQKGELLALSRLAAWQAGCRSKGIVTAKWKSLFGASVLAGLVAVVLVGWVRMPVSNQELLANFAKAGDFFRGMESVRGIPWWSPNFLQGTSLAMAWSYMLSNVVMLVGSLPFGFLIGSKIAVGASLLVGAAGMYCFLKRWGCRSGAAWIGAILFLLNPSVLTRAAGFEHFVVVVSLAVLPWVFRALVVFFEEATLRSALIAGVCFSLLVLAYGKTGLMALPVLMVFAASLFFLSLEGRRPDWRLWLLAGAVVFVLAVLPNLPALREAGFVAMFEFGPFEGWQRAFSSKSALSWLDWGGVLGEGMDSGFAPTTLNGGTYLGVGCFLLLAGVLWSGVLHGSESGRRARLLLALALGAFWLSFGPRSVMGGHFEFLKMSGGAADFTPALAWFLLMAQVWIIFRLVPSGSRLWQWAAVGISVVYLFVPGFRLLELLPIYRNIRAPFDFYQVTGVLCLIGAVAMAAGVLMERISAPLVRQGLVVALLFVAALDAFPYARPFFQERLEPAVWSDFLKAQEFLKSAPEPGRVYAFSGRYFYLLTPWLSGRALSAEAFNSYLQQRSVAVLQGSAFLNDELMENCLRVSGVAYVLVDKSDPDTKPDLQQKLRDLFPPVFENEHFAVLGMKNPLGFGFLAQDFLRTTSSQPETAIAAMGGAGHNLAVIELAGSANDEPGLRGEVVDGHIAASEGKVLDEGRSFTRIAKKPDGTFQQVAFEPTTQAGWLVFNEAWHPDWTVREGNDRLEIHRALLAFSAVKTSGQKSVVFEFRPPWWYGACVYTSLVCWIATLVTLCFFSRQACRTC